MPPILRIGDLTLDTGRQRLTQDTVPIHLGPLTFRLLLALVDAAPNVASHDELARTVWNGRPVSPETISQRVKLLRDAIGDHADDPRYIELVRGRGYRLLPQVEAVTPADPQRRYRRALWGSVRRSGDRIRVTVQLVSAADGTHVWSAAYESDFDDVPQLQGEITRSISAALEAKLLGPVTVAHAQQPVNPTAYDLYLRGRQRLRDNRLGDAERYLEHSLALDPDFVPAYVAHGEACVLRIMDNDVPIGQYREKLRDLLGRGLEYAPDDAGLIGLSGQLARYDGDIGLAEERFREALKRDPADVTVRMMYAMLKGDQGYPEQAVEITRRAREIDPLNRLNYLGDWSVGMDVGDAKEALKATERYAELAAPSDAGALGLRSLTRLVLLGDLAGAARDWAAVMDISTSGATRCHADLLSYMLGDLEKGDATSELHDRVPARYPGDAFAVAYRHLVTGEIARARELVLPLFKGRGDYAAFYPDPMIARLAVDALIVRGDANLAIGIIEDMAPQYVSFRAMKQMEPEAFSPAPYPVKSVYSSYPAQYFPDYIHALRAAGETGGAENMLNHLEGILQWRRVRGLLVEERHVAEARALRRDDEGALNALEQALGDRTIFQGWHVFLLHNPTFADIREHPRFMAVVGQVQDEVRRQRVVLSASK